MLSISFFGTILSDYTAVQFKCQYIYYVPGLITGLIQLRPSKAKNLGYERLILNFASVYNYPPLQLEAAQSEASMLCEVFLLMFPHRTAGTSLLPLITVAILKVATKNG